MQGCGDGYSNNAPLCVLAILHQVLLHPPTDALSVVYVPTNCEAHLTPLVGVIFAKWECSCTWIVLQTSIWQAVFAQKRPTNGVKCLPFRSLGRQLPVGYQASVGSLPSRTLGQMSLCGNNSAPALRERKKTFFTHPSWSNDFIRE